MQNIIKVENLSVAFGKQKILKNLNFSVDERDILAILGPNGAGKTTLLKTFARILKPAEGSIKILGKDISYIPLREYSKIVSYMTQRVENLFPFTCNEFVLMGRYPWMNVLGIEGEKDKKIAEQVMEITDVNFLKNRLITEISGGEFRRVLLARVLCQNTPIILLDEPTDSLDIHYQISIMQKIKRITKEKKRTTIIVFHDLNIALQFCDKVLLLKGGEIVACGEVEYVMKESLIRETFNVEVYVGRNEINDKIFVIPSG